MRKITVWQSALTHFNLRLNEAAATLSVSTESVAGGELSATEKQLLLAVRAHCGWMNGCKHPQTNTDAFT